MNTTINAIVRTGDYAKDYENGKRHGHFFIMEMARSFMTFKLADEVQEIVLRPGRDGQLDGVEAGFFAAFAEAAVDSARSLYAGPEK